MTNPSQHARERLVRLWAFFAFCLALGSFAPFSRAYAHSVLPNHLSFELLPVTLSNGHQRGLGLGMSIEWLKPDEGTLAALSSEISWPLLQERDPLARVDWAGSFALMGAVHPTFFVGAKVGMNINAMGGPVGLLALSIRHLPKDQSAFGFLQWVEKQIDIGLHANKNLYAAVRLGFSLL